METELVRANPLSLLLQRRFYFSMALAMAVIVAAGFSRTIDAGLIHPSFVVPWILYVHVALFVGWILLLIVQTGLVQTRQVQLHRTLGLSSVGFGVALVIVGVWVSLAMARIEAQQGDAGASAFLIVPFFDMLAFSLLFGIGVRLRRHVELHRRLMLMAAWSLTAAAFGRLPIVPQGGWFYFGVDLMIFLGVLRDLLVAGRIHRVYLIALPLMMVGQFATISTLRAAWWMDFSQALIR